MKSKILGLMVASLLALFGEAYANLIVTVTKDPGGGTDWAFSGGSGAMGANAGACCFLPGATTANPQDFRAANDFGVSISVLAGTDPFGFAFIVVRDYGGLDGSNGAIFNGIDFQTLSDIGGKSLASLNGLVLRISDFSFDSLNPGTYTLDSYLAGAFNLYATLPGTFTLVVGAAVAEPGTFALIGLGLAGLAATRRPNVA